MAIVSINGIPNLPVSSVITGGEYNGDASNATIGTVNYDNGNNYTFTGSFSFDFAGNLTGTNLDQVTLENGGQTIATLRGINTNPAATQDLVEAGNQQAFINFFLAGDDSISGSNSADAITGGNGMDTIDGGTGDDLLFGGTGLVSVDDGADIIIGGIGDDSLYGNAGDDTIYGGTGIFSPDDASDEFLHGGKGSDALYGNGGNDTLYGGEGNDSTFGGEGDDLLYGGWQIFDPTDTADTMVGGNGNDTIYGNGGDDLIQGQGGNDSMHGGLGNDTYMFDFSDTGSDTVLQFEGAGVDGGDVLNFSDTSLLFATTAASIANLVNYADGNATIDFSLVGLNLDVTIIDVAAGSITANDIIT